MEHQSVHNFGQYLSSLLFSATEFQSRCTNLVGTSLLEIFQIFEYSRAVSA